MKIPKNTFIRSCLYVSSTCSFGRGAIGFGGFKKLNKKAPPLQIINLILILNLQKSNEHFYFLVLI